MVFQEFAAARKVKQDAASQRLLDLMARPVTCARATTPVSAVREKLSALGVNGMPVIDEGGQLIG